MRSTVIALTITVAVLGGVACKSRKADDQKKVDELQAQLDDAKRQLAAKEQAAKDEAARQAEAAASPATPAPQPPPARPARSAKAAGRATSNLAPTGRAASAAPPPSTSTPDAHAEELARLAEQQRAVNQNQAHTNDQVQRQIEELKPVEFHIPAGTIIPVRTTTELSTSQLANGSGFDALLERDIVVDGTVLAAKGAHVGGVVVSSDPGGRVKGVASLDVTIRTLAGRQDHTIRIKTDSYSAVADTNKGKDAKRTGIMAGAGAVVGAIAGGGKGAAIGAGAGAAAGVGTNMATRGKAAVIPAETLIEFRLASPATVVLQP